MEISKPSSEISGEAINSQQTIGVLAGAATSGHHIGLPKRDTGGYQAAFLAFVK